MTTTVTSERWIVTFVNESREKLEKKETSRPPQNDCHFSPLSIGIINKAYCGKHCEYSQIVPSVAVYFERGFVVRNKKI